MVGLLRAAFFLAIPSLVILSGRTVVDGFKLGRVVHGAQKLAIEGPGEEGDIYGDASERNMHEFAGWFGLQDNEAAAAAANDVDGQTSHTTTMEEEDYPATLDVRRPARTPLRLQEMMMPTIRTAYHATPLTIEYEILGPVGNINDGPETIYPTPTIERHGTPMLDRSSETQSTIATEPFFATPGIEDAATEEINFFEFPGYW